jgi:hypothetical protein
VPDWLPKTRLWFGLERYGQEGAAAVVERLVQEAGGVIRPETAEDKVARLARDLADEGARVKLRQSEEGVGRATDAAEVVLNEIRAITVATPGGLAFAVTREPRGIAVYANGVSVVMVQSNTYTNTVDHFRMVMTLWAGRPDFAGVSYLGAKELGHRSFVPDFDRNGEVLWRGESSKKAMTSRQLAETAVTGLLDEIRKDSLKGR